MEMHQIVKMKGINKSFPGVKALDNVEFDLNSGEVLALLGENGAGKSTLMKILSGVYVRDAGSIQLFGKDVGMDWDSNKARDNGIAIIHQELNMCKHMSVAENIFLGREIVKNRRLDEKAMNKETAKILKQFNMDMDPETIVGNLSVSKQQMVEIAKALSMNAKILIMDEPTSALTSKEIDELFRIIRELKKEGKGIVYISHRLEELKHIVDRVIVMRDGHYITEMIFDENKMDQIITHMVGREIKEKFPRVQCNVGKTIFEVKNLNAGKLVRNVSFELHEGEIVGIAGLMGAGRTETTRAIFGVDPKESGQIFIEGKEVNIKAPIDAINAGLVLAPEDRKKDGLCTRLSVLDNIALPNLDLLGGLFGNINRKEERRMVEKEISDLKIKLPRPEVDAGSLSGGNQQKVVIGKGILTEPKILLMDEPSRGIDIGAKTEVFDIINQYAKRGLSIIVVSSELQEIVAIADRVMVLSNGLKTGEFCGNEIKEDTLVLASYKGHHTQNQEKEN